MAWEHSSERIVEFADTDMAGIVHFANTLRYMEAAEHAFLASLGFSICSPIDGVTYGWPRVHVACSYVSPLRFEDRLRIRTVLQARKTRALSFVHLLYRLPEADGEPVLAAVGRMTLVCVRRDGESMRACPLPAAMAAALESAPPEALAGIDLP